MASKEASSQINAQPHINVQLGINKSVYILLEDSKLDVFVLTWYAICTPRVCVPDTSASGSNSETFACL